MSKVALIRFGYQDYAVPVEALSETLNKLAALKRVESRYETGWYVYWYSAEEEGDFSVTVVSSERILATDPGKTLPITATKTTPAPDDRIIAAPSDPNPISIGNVPPTRGFVDEYRDGEASDATGQSRIR